MENYFGKNLKLLRLRKKRSQQEFADYIGVSRSIVNNYERAGSNPSVENLIAISTFFNISLDTFVKVDFSKLPVKDLIDLERGLDIFSKGANFRVLATTIDDKNRNNVEMVSVKTKAGYTAGYSDPGFIKTLPSYYFPLLPKERKHRLFQISGDSMPPAKDKSWIACEYVEDWRDIKSGTAYVVVTKDDGLVFKIAYNRIKEAGTLLLVSLNTFYQPYEIPAKEILEVWKFSMHFNNELMQD